MSLRSLLGTLVICAGACAAGEVLDHSRAVALSAPRGHGVGHLVDDLQLGDGVTLAELVRAEGTSAVVVAMRDAGCPVSKKGRPALERLVESMAERGVRFVFVYPGAHQTLDDARADLEADGLVVMDSDGALATALGARTTTEAFVLDRARTLRFRGAVDDQYGIGFTRADVGHTFLADALDAVLTGEDVAVAVTTAPGCLLEFEGTPFYADVSTPTYHGDVARIVQDHCLRCHRDEGVAPFSLETFDDVRGRHGMIRHVLVNGLMPPWGAAPDTGPWANDPTLSGADMLRLQAWAEAGMPEGDVAEAPLPRHYPIDWAIGEPDAVYSLPEAMDVPAEGVVEYKYAYVQTSGTEDRWIRAMEVRPSAHGVVHHVLVFIEEPRREGESRDEWRRRERGGLDGYFAAYVPGQGATFYPEGMGQRLPAGAWLKFQVHYTPNGRATSDRTEIGFVFADDVPDTVVRTGGIFETRFRIPPGADDYVVEAAAEFGRPATLLGLSPHMHLRGKSFRYVAVYPDGSQETLLDVPRYDFNWQRMYRFETPKELPGGTRIVCVAHFDNSADNPANPDPSRSVRFGEQTFDEMMIGYMEWWRE